MADEVVLSEHDIMLLQEVARGLTNDQISLRAGLTRPQVDAVLKAVYRKMGVFEKGLKSRAYALAVAVKRFGLEPPEEMIDPIAKLSSGEVMFDEVDIMILKLVAEGKSLPDMASTLGIRRQDISLRLADMRLRISLSLIRPFCVAAAAIWAGLMEHLELDNERPLTADEIELLCDVICEVSSYDTGVRLGINMGAARARIRALVLRLGVHTEAQAVEQCIRKGWLQIPVTASTDDQAQRVVDAISIVASEGLSENEAQAVRLLAEGKQRPEIADAIFGAGEEKRLTRLNAMLDRLYGRLDLGAAAAVVAVVAWAGWPEPTLPERYYRTRLSAEDRPDPRLITEDDVELLVLLVQIGLSVDEISAELTKRTGHQMQARPLMGILYRKLGAVNGFHAVGMATRDGLLDAYFETQDLDAVRADMFSLLYVRSLQMQGSGTPVYRNAWRLGVSSQRTFERRTRSDREVGRQPITAIAYLVRRGEIEVQGKSLVPLVAESVAAGLLPSKGLAVAQVEPAAVASDPDDRVPGATLVASGLPGLPGVDAPATQPMPDPEQRAGADPERDTAAPLGAGNSDVNKVANMAAANRTNREVMRGQSALSKNLGQYIGSHFDVTMVAIRAGMIPRPWVHSAIEARITERPLSTQVELFIQRIADGVPLDEIREEMETLVREAAAGPQDFRRWYMRYVCGLFAVRGPREAAAVAAWYGLIT